jgi:hypothetical protein
MRHEPHVTHADRHDGGVILTFEDGKTAYYPSTLLRSIFDQAKEFPEVDEDDKDA